jgi:hypothetical protein
MNEQERREALGPAERIIQTITSHVDHAMHNRPGFVVADPSQKIGARWQQATWIEEGPDGRAKQKVVYTVRKVGKRQQKTRVGVLNGDGRVEEAGRVVGSFRDPGLFPEAVAYLYGQVAEVWRIDNEFAAKWASHAWSNDENRDLKVILAAFMLVQSRFGEPVKDGDSILLDEDYRAVGEAMCLLRSKKKGFSFDPKLLLRIGEVLELPQVVEINRRLGFGQGGRSAVVGRYYKVIEKWLGHQEANPKLLEKLVKEKGFRKKVMALARKVGYKPTTDRFFELLRWKQVQAKDGRRAMAIGKAVEAAESWAGLTEKQICTKITKEKPGYKRLVGLLGTAITPAIMAAAIESGCLSDADLIILTPTLEELGLLDVEAIGARWRKATERAENQRAANIARNVKSQAVKEELEKAADTAAQAAVAEVAKDFRIYVVVDKSGSMQGAIDRAKELASKMVSAFPLDRMHVCLFNTVGTEIRIQRATTAGVAQAFRGHGAGGGTSYAAGIHCLLREHKPDPEEDVLFFFIGDEDDPNAEALVRVIREHNVQPVAFGLLHVESPANYPRWLPRHQANIISRAAGMLNVPRTLRNLIASTPVRQVATATAAAPRRTSLIDDILKTPLLQRPVWAN